MSATSLRYVDRALIVNGLFAVGCGLVLVVVAARGPDDFPWPAFFVGPILAARGVLFADTRGDRYLPKRQEERFDRRSSAGARCGREGPRHRLPRLGRRCRAARFAARDRIPARGRTVPTAGRLHGDGFEHAGG